jgi:hypothetical protein
MKYKHLILAILAVSLMAMTFVSTASADVYFATMVGIKSGKDFTFTINTSTASTGGPTPSIINNFAAYVATGSLSITVTDSKNVVIIIPVDWTNVAVNPDGSSIVVELVKKDGIPSHAISVNAQGTLTGPYAGNTFLASGPGWTWGNIR